MKADKRGGEFGFLNDGCAEGTLISKAAEGDDTAFELLMKAHLKVIYNYICIHVESKEDVQDLVQETMLGVWSGLKYFRNDSSFRTWVMGITRRKVYDFYRSRYKTSELTMPEDEGSLVSEDEPDRLLETLDVNSAVNRLNSMEQELVFLAFNAQLTYQEISEVTGIPLGTVKSRMSGVRSKLRKYLEKE